MTTATDLASWRLLRRLIRDGTLVIAAGSVVAGLGAYAYQILAGQVLGAVDFAPLSVLLTIHFLAFSVVLMPIEQLVIRHMALAPDEPAVPAVAWWTTGLLAAGAGAFALATRERFFEGQWEFALVAAGSVVTHAVFAIGRGYLAGRGDYPAYGYSSAAAVMVRLAATALVLALGATALGFGWALVVGALAVLAWRPARRRPQRRPRKDLSGRLLFGLVLAAGSSQVLLLAGTLVAALLTTSAVVVSTVFATFTLFRAPLVLGYNLLARVLPPFTVMARAGKQRELNIWALRIVGTGVLGAGVAAAGGGLLGPWVIAKAFGADFRPDWPFAALVAAGVVLAGAGLFVGQVLVARADAARLVGAWLVAVATAVGALFLPVTDPALRVGVAFLIGEIGALTALLAGVMVTPSARRAAVAR